MQSWTPSIGGSGPLWRGLVEVLAQDIRGGALPPGSRLPPHRDLAFRLSVGVGTVARAYLEAERRGLVVSHVGRGTFVAERRSAPLASTGMQRVIDMARNVTPLAPSAQWLDATLDSLRRRPDLAEIAGYSPTAGLEVVREAGAAWLSTHGRVGRARADRLIQTSGGQHALLLACSSAARTGETILCDAATYPGNRTIASFGGWKLHGVPADEHGIDPDALDHAAAATGARALLLIPTLHNPTTRTLNADRRSEVVEVARKRNLTIIEDDIYRTFGRPEDPVPFAELAPERTVFVSSLSKALSPGLRLGFVLPPDEGDLHERLLFGAQATLYCPAPTGGLMFAQWMEDGTAVRIRDGVLAEVRARNELAHAILGDAIDPPDSPHSLHVWLPMDAARAHRVAGEAMKAGVEVTPPDAPFVDSSAVCGLRLCLGTAADRDELAYALREVRLALDDGHAHVNRGIV